MGYERSDVNIGGIVGFGVALLVASLVVLLLMWGLFSHFNAREAKEESAVLPATRIVEDQPQRPPEPVLQAAPGSKYELRDPLLEMKDVRRAEDVLLNSAGWVDPNAGVVRIPIEQAKKLLLERGLPSRQQPAARGNTKSEASAAAGLE